MRSRAYRVLETIMLVALLGTLMVLAACSFEHHTVSPQPRRADGARDEDAGALPGGYSPRISCGDLGKACSDEEGCEGGLTCSEGLCLPPVSSTGTCAEGCPKHAPVCAGSTCVGVDQLACICLDPHGARAVPQCHHDDPAQCIAVDGLCDAEPNACCRGTLCVQGQDDEGRQLLGLCKRRCTYHDNCDTGCCAEHPDIGGKFCAAHEVCEAACGELDAACDGEFRPCCDGLLCVRSDEAPSLNGCKKPCTKPSDCESECCAFFAGPHGGSTGNGVCAESSLCKP